MKPDFMDRTAKIIEEVRTRTCIDKLDTEVLEDIEAILQLELNEYYKEVFTYARNIGYDEGHSDGYDDGHSDGYEAVYDAGYSAGYSDGYSDCYYDG